MFFIRFSIGSKIDAKMFLYFTFRPVIRVYGVIGVNITSVGGNMLIHMALAITVSKINLMGLIFNGRMFHVVRVLSLIVWMHHSIFGKFSYLPMVLSSIFSDLSPYCRGSNSFLALQYVMQNPL